jgi:hypothetical protein
MAGGTRHALGVCTLRRRCTTGNTLKGQHPANKFPVTDRATVIEQQIASDAGGDRHPLFSAVSFRATSTIT